MVTLITSTQIEKSNTETKYHIFDILINKIIDSFFFKTFTGRGLMCTQPDY